MAKRHVQLQTFDEASVSPQAARVLGLLAFLVGLALLALYPVDLTERFTSGYTWPADGTPLPGPPKSQWIFPSGLIGPVLIAWGAFASRDATIAPLTLRRALLAPVLGALALGAGAARFTYAMVQETPALLNTDTGGEQTLDPSVAELLASTVGTAQFASVAAAAALVVGTVTARHGRRHGLVVAALPGAVLLLGELWQPHLRELAGRKLVVSVAVLALFLAGPFVVGYLAAKRRRHSF